MSKIYQLSNGDTITYDDRTLKKYCAVVITVSFLLICIFLFRGCGSDKSDIGTADTSISENELYEEDTTAKDIETETAAFEERQTVTEEISSTREPESSSCEAESTSEADSSREATTVSSKQEDVAENTTEIKREAVVTVPAIREAQTTVTEPDITEKPEEKKEQETTTEKHVAEQTVSSNEYAFPIHYSDATSTIDIEKINYAGSVCYIAHLKFSDYSRFGTESAYGKYGSGYETTSHAASRLGAIFCVNGDYSSVECHYGTIRHGYIANRTANGKFYPETIYNYHNGLLGDKSMLGISGSLTIDEAVSSGLATDTFQFAPASLVNGVNKGDPNGTSRAQRTFIGTNGNPGDIYIVVSEGRYVDGKSAGLNGYECMQLLKERGCIFGNFLDGGGSSTMVYKGKILNTVSPERAVIDFAYFK